MQRFEGIHAMVTGAGSGIGFATAQRLAEEGASIVAVGRNQTRLEAAVESLPCPERHIALPFDASDESAVEKAFAQLREMKRPLGMAVFAAGEHMLRPLSLTKAVHIDKLLSSNVKSALICTKAFAKQAPMEGGSVVLLASAAGLVGNFGEAIYAAAKGAVVSACRSLAAELAVRKIRVNAVAPAVVKTAMSEAWLRQLKPDQLSFVENRHLLGFGEPADVAASIAFLGSSDARWITGTCLVVDGGFVCH